MDIVYVINNGLYRIRPLLIPNLKNQLVEKGPMREIELADGSLYSKAGDFPEFESSREQSILLKLRVVNNLQMQEDSDPAKR